MFWVVMDVIFSVLTIAVAGLTQYSISTFCTSGTLTWDWSASNFAYVPPNLRVPSDFIDSEAASFSITLEPLYMKLACGFGATIIGLSVIQM